MSKMRTNIVREIFEQALALEPSKRQTFLDATAPQGSATRSEVDALLKLDRSVGDLIDSLAGEPKEAIVAPGTILADRYEIQDTIGEGGFGVVYAARQTHPVLRNVAVKIARKALLSRSARERFDAERQALAVMQHPGIAQIFDAGTLPDGRPFIAMERVDGQPITRAAANLSLAQRIHAIIDIADAVQHAHQKGVVHRDLKPSNILAFMQSGKLRSKIIDFGIIRALGGAPSDLPRVNDGASLMGTPRYMAPEQRSLDALEIDTRADQYALAVLAADLLYNCELEESLFAAAAETWPECKAAPDIPYVLCKALSSDPNYRYPSISEFAADLSHALAHAPVIARPATRAYLTRCFVRRNRLGVSLAAAALILAAGAFAAISYSLSKEHEARKDAEVARTRAQKQTDEAVAANARADAEKSIALQQSYSAALSAASAAIAQDDAATAQRWLQKTPAELRGWEWRLVASRADSSLSAFSQSSSPITAITRTPHNAVTAWLDSRGTLCIQHNSDRIVLSDFADARALAFSSDGATLFVARADSIVPVRISDGLCASSWPIDDPSTLLSRGTTVIVGRRSAPALVVDAATGTRLRQIGGITDTSALAALSADGRFLALTTAPKSISILDLDRPALINRITLHAPISALALSSSANQIATSLTDGSIYIYDALTGASTQHIDRAARTIAFAPDGRTLLASTDSGAIHLFDLSSGNRLGSILGHTDRVSTLSVSLPEGVLSSGSFDGSVRTWDLLTLCRRSPQGRGPAIAISSQPDNESLAVLRPSCVELFDESASDLLHDVDLPRDFTASALAFAGHSLIVADKDSSQLLALRDHAWPALGTASAPATALLGSPCGRFLAVESLDCKTQLLRIEGDHANSLWQSDDAEPIAFSPDGSTLLIAHAGRHALQLVDSATGNSRKNLPLPPNSSLFSARFISADRLAIALTDSRLLMYQPGDTKLLAAGAPDLGSLIIAGQTSDGRLICSSASSVLSFDATTLRLIASVPAQSMVQGASLSQDGLRLTTWTNSGTAIQHRIPVRDWTPPFMTLYSQR